LRNATPGCDAIITCLSELLAIHGLSKLYGFLINLMPLIEEKGGITVGMLVEEGQPRSEEIIISSIFDATFKVRVKEGEVVFDPMTNLNVKPTRLRFLEPLSNEVNLGTTLP